MGSLTVAMDDDDGMMDSLFSTFMNEVDNIKSNKMKKLEEKAGNPEEIVERLTSMTYDPKQGQGSAFMVLQISPEASESEITKAYRKLSLLIHPDKCKLEKAPEAFQVLAKAYADTKDPSYNDKYQDIYGPAKDRVRKAREKENEARAKKGEDPLDTEGNDFDREVLKECERMLSGAKEAATYSNSVLEANMKRQEEQAVEGRKRRREEDKEKKSWEKQRDKRVAGWQVFMHNVEKKKVTGAETSWRHIGKVGAADLHHKREERKESDKKAEVDLDDKKVRWSATQAGQVGIDRSYREKWR